MHDIQNFRASISKGELRIAGVITTASGIYSVGFWSVDFLDNPSGVYLHCSEIHRPDDIYVAPCCRQLK